MAVDLDLDLEVAFAVMGIFDLHLLLGVRSLVGLRITWSTCLCCSLYVLVEDLEESVVEGLMTWRLTLHVGAWILEVRVSFLFIYLFIFFFKRFCNCRMAKTGVFFLTSKSVTVI